MVAKPRNRKVKRLESNLVEPQAIGGRNGSPLTRNGEGEEIIYARLEREWKSDNKNMELILKTIIKYKGGDKMPTGYNYTNKDLKNKCLEIGFHMLSDEVCTLQQKCDFIDIHGYKYNTTCGSLFKNNSSFIVSNKNPYSIMNIKTWISINKFNIELISDVYESTHENLKWKCLLCGTIFEDSWNKINRDTTLKCCESCRKNQNRNLIIEKDIEFFKKEGYDVISEYTRKDEFVTIIDDLGYKYKTKYKIYVKNNGLLKWSPSNPYSLYNIANWLKINKYDDIVALSDDNKYISCYSPLLWRCGICENEFKMSLTEMLSRNEKCCYNCVKHIRVQSCLDDNINKIEECGYTVLSKCNKLDDKVNIMDKEGYKYCMLVSEVTRGDHRIISPDNPYSIDNIKLWMIKNNIKSKLISNVYTKGKDINLVFTCESCGREYTTSWNQLLKQRKTRCGICTKSQSNISYLTECYILDLNLCYKKEIHFENLRGENNARLRFDYGIYDENNDIKLIIEVDGSQHYYFKSFKTISKLKDDSIAKIGFAKLKHYDKMKNKYCEENNIPILRLPYWLFDKELSYKKIIYNKILSLNL